MSVKVKICGVRTPAILDAAVAAGADYAGLVVFPRSPRHVTVEEAQSLAAAARGRIATVAVLVDPDDALIDRVVDIVDPDFIQLHGSENPGPGRRDQGARKPRHYQGRPRLRQRRRRAGRGL